MPILGSSIHRLLQAHGLSRMTGSASLLEEKRSFTPPPVSGLMTGLLGVDGGFIIVPALLRCSNISMNGIFATSLMVIALISNSAVIAAYTTVIWSEPAFLFIGGAVIGMLIGRQFAGKIPASYMHRGFFVLVTVVAFALFYKLCF